MREVLPKRKKREDRRAASEKVRVNLVNKKVQMKTNEKSGHPKD